MSLMFTKFACATLLLAASGVTSAGVVWKASDCSDPSDTKLARVCTSSSPGLPHSVTLTAWSATYDKTFAAASLVRYGDGFGIVGSGEKNSPQHAIDNNGATDAILMHFDTDVALNLLTSSWFKKDSDVSILRYTGELAPVLGDFRVDNLLDNPLWKSAGDYATLRPGTPLKFNEDGTAAASWWLVSAFDPLYADIKSTSTLGRRNDYFKLKSFGADIVVKEEDVSDVPEPASLSLLGIAALGIAASRRKRSSR